MNYQAEVRAFYDQLEVNDLSQSAILLWHALMHLYHKTGPKSPFTIARSVIEVNTRLKKDAYYRAREQLKQVGMIDFQAKGNQATAFTLFSLQTATQTVNEMMPTQLTTHSPTQLPMQIATFNKERKEEERRINWHDIEITWQEVFRYSMKRHHIEMLTSFMEEDKMADSLIIEAIDRVRNADSPNVNYLWRTLGDWAKKEIKSIQQLIEHDQSKVDYSTKQPDNLLQLDEFYQKLKQHKGVKDHDG
ncbi:DnaD domain protein [Bacillus sp. FJAT-52991]|uniref:DnaD domain protein n=1 Tax=Bacillus kandeliae TaxID=3129297 RepID=A0ABZ2N275_9BACI